MRLKGKIALITGGARHWLCHCIGTGEGGGPNRHRGYQCQRCPGGSRKTQSYRGGGSGLEVNVAEQPSVEAMIAAIVGHFGRLDILVNNAGVGGNTPFLDTRLEDWNRIVSINLTGAFLVAQASARQMVAQGANGEGGGKIINKAPPLGRGSGSCSGLALHRALTHRASMG